jgi:hypothetical protein
MKKEFFILFLLVCQVFFSHAFDQNPVIMDSTIFTKEKKSEEDFHTSSKKEKKSPGYYHEHRGFHVELSIGPAFGKVTQRLPAVTGYDEYDYTGTGAGVDVKIGGAVKRNFCLTLDLVSKGIPAPDIDKNGETFSRESRNSVGEVTYGAGFTYFFSTDVFFSTTIGSGRFILDDSLSATRMDNGFSMQLRAGKHLWISRHWGISLAGTYGFTSVNNLGDSRRLIFEDIKSDRFMIVAGIVLN